MRTGFTHLLALAVMAWAVVPAYSAYAASNMLTQPGGGTSSAGHDGAGDLVQVVAANGTTQHWSYDRAGQAIGATVVMSGTTLFSQTDTLDAAGERTAQVDSWGRAHA